MRPKFGSNCGREIWRCSVATDSDAYEVQLLQLVVPPPPGSFILEAGGLGIEDFGD